MGRNPYKKCECGQMMAFINTAKDKYIPVNVESLSEVDRHELSIGAKVVFDSKRHISHFADCPNAKRFRRQQ